MKRHLKHFGAATLIFSALAMGQPVSADSAYDVAQQRDRTTLRLAAWNLSNLHHEAGQSVPGRDVIRSREDYKWIRHYADKLDADVIALQEANSRAAIHRAFSRGRYNAYISGRKTKDLDAYDLTGKWPDASIYTGFAVRKGIKVTRVESVPSLEIMHADPRNGTRRPTRWAVELEIEHQGQPFVILSVHLKSGCSIGALKDASTPYERYVSNDPDCTTLARQVKPLRAWIDEQLAAGKPFAIIGDFNRAFDVDGDRDHLWLGMTDNLAGGRSLTRFPEGRAAECWKGAPPAHYYTNPIDFIVLDDRAARMARPRSFRWVTFDTALAIKADLISDHCPLSLDIGFSNLSQLPAFPVDIAQPNDRSDAVFTNQFGGEIPLYKPIAPAFEAMGPQP